MATLLEFYDARLVALRAVLDRELEKYNGKIDPLIFLKIKCHEDGYHCVSQDDITEDNIRDVFAHRIVCGTAKAPMTDGERETLIEALVAEVVHYHKLIRGQTYGETIHGGGAHHPPNF